MAKLADLAAISETIQVRGHDFDVQPLDLATIAALLARYPDLAAALGFVDGNAGDIVDAILSSGAGVINAIIDAALGEAPGTAAKARLTAVEQGNIVAAAIQLTLPDQEEELGNFMRRLAALFGKVGSAVEASKPAAGSI